MNKEHAKEGSEYCEPTGEEERGKELISAWTFSKQRLERQTGQQWVGDKPLPEIST
jgi:hypothetical protein